MAATARHPSAVPVQEPPGVGDGEACCCRRYYRLLQVPGSLSATFRLLEMTSAWTGIGIFWGLCEIIIPAFSRSSIIDTHIKIYFFYWLHVDISILSGQRVSPCVSVQRGYDSLAPQSRQGAPRCEGPTHAGEGGLVATLGACGSPEGHGSLTRWRTSTDTIHTYMCTIALSLLRDI